jgi:hypothetical protein
VAGQRSALIDRRVVEYDPEIEIGVRSVGAFGNRSGELRRDGSDHSPRGSHYRVDTVGGDVAQVDRVATFYRPGLSSSRSPSSMSAASSSGKRPTISKRSWERRRVTARSMSAALIAFSAERCACKQAARGGRSARSLRAQATASSSSASRSQRLASVFTSGGGSVVDHLALVGREVEK